jgi:hypothetical protein
VSLLRNRRYSPTSFALGFGAVCLLTIPQTSQAVTPDTEALQDFDRRVATYEKLHDKIHSELSPKPTRSAEKVGDLEEKFSARVRPLRADAHQGDVFTKPIAAEFRRLIAMTMRGKDAARIRISLRHAEPVRAPIKVNDRYPSYIPLQSTPPSLLLNLPRLPKGLDYRLVGHSLVLRDVVGNLIIDFIPNAIS